MGCGAPLHVSLQWLCPCSLEPAAVGGLAEEVSEVLQADSPPSEQPEVICQNLRQISLEKLFCFTIVSKFEVKDSLP